MPPKTNHPLNVLVFPAGTEIGLEIRRSLKDILHFKLIGGTSQADHSNYVYSNHIGNIPYITHELECIAALNQIIVQHHIDIIYPAHDEVLRVLSKALSEGSLDQKIKLITSEYETCELARSKSLTYQHLHGTIDVPLTYKQSDISSSSLPLFCKPDRGQGSKGAYQLTSNDQIKGLKADDIVCELLKGKEYTVDCFTDKNGILRYSSARRRSRVSNGISVASDLIEDHSITQIAEKINTAVNFRGGWFFQLKQRTEQGPYVLLEIAPRIAGGMGFSRAKGVNLPALSIYDQMGYDLEIFTNKSYIRRDCALYPKYHYGGTFTNIYVDLDDTLIFGDRVNGSLLGLLYEFKNDNKKIFLITRHHAVHGTHLLNTLAKYFIPPNFFEKIIEVKKGDKKSKFIPTDSIFIDDSTSERYDVASNCSIDTFTCTQFNEIFSK